MKIKKILLVPVISLFTLGSATAQSPLTQWQFDNALVGTVDDIAASSAHTGLTVSALTSSGGTSSYGVIDQTFGSTQATGSANFSGSGFEVGMNTLQNTETPPSDGYALNFSTTVKSGYTLDLASFSFDLGYDTNYATSSPNYYAPYAQLYVSLDNSNWTAVGSAQTLDISDPDIFSTGAGSGGVYYIEDSLTVDLTSVTATVLPENSTVYFRLALSDEGSGSDRRRVLVDNISVDGTITAIPEASSYVLCLGLVSLLGVLTSRYRS